jgi:antitoxin component YwqK of YwqJK toxin-antitoxin module
MNVVEFLSFNRVATGIIVGIEKDPTNKDQLIYTVRITEQFNGPESDGTIVINDANAWRLNSSKVGSKALFFTEMKDGKEVLSSQDLSMPVASGFSLKASLANASKDDMNWLIDAHEREVEEMDRAFKNFRTFTPMLTDGTHQLKSGDHVISTFNVKNGKLSGQFESFTWEGETFEKGHFVNGQRAGAWSLRIGEDKYKIVKYNEG